MGDELQLRAKIVGVLNSRACLDIRFVAAGISILGYHYGYLCDLVCQHCVGVSFGVEDPDALAEYNDRSNTLRFARRDLGFYATHAGRAQIVHECTHAVIDVVRAGKTVRRADNEAIAWIAQTMFLLLSGQTVPEGNDFRQSLAAVARDAIARSRDDGPYVVPASATSFIGETLQGADKLRAKKRGLSVPDVETMSGIPWPRPEPMQPE
ncbi:hypothetical protein [Methylocella sp.]|uniref:hypothetical protein n=1 Tax=Methylocella sp. TaxID=1978226 RepID=UPI0037852D9C